MAGVSIDRDSAGGARDTATTVEEQDPDPALVHLLERIYRAFNDRDIDALLSLVGPAFEWHPNPDEPELKVARTPQDLVAGLRDRWESLPRLRTEVEDIGAVGERLVADVRHEAVLRGSDTPLERREVHVWSFRAGRVIRLQEFPSRDAALKAL